jgi:hypothetical protein
VLALVVQEWEVYTKTHHTYYIQLDLSRTAQQWTTTYKRHNSYQENTYNSYELEL